MTAGLVDAGVGEGLARTLVASVRGVASAALDGEKKEARALAETAIRAGLGEAQRAVVDFLVTERRATRCPSRRSCSRCSRCRG